MVLQTSTTGEPAVVFGLRLTPLAGGLADLMADPAALALMRSALAGVAGAGGGATAGDRVFFSSIFTLATGVYTQIADDDAINTLGKTLNSSAAVVASLSAAGASRRRLAVQGGGGAAAAPQRRPAPATRLARALGLAIPPLNTSALTPDATSKGSYVTFAVLAPSLDAASAMKQSLLSGSASLPAALAPSLALISNATGQGPISSTLDRTSVAVIMLTYTQTYWSLLWDYIAANIVNVLAAGCALAVLVLVWGCGRAFYAGGVSRARKARGRQCWPTIHPANYLRRRKALDEAREGATFPLPGFLEAGEEGGGSASGAQGTRGFLTSAKDRLFQSMAQAKARTQMRSDLSLLLNPDKTWERLSARRSAAPPPAAAPVHNYALDAGLNLDYGRASMDPGFGRSTSYTGAYPSGSTWGGGAGTGSGSLGGSYFSPTASAGEPAVLRARLGLPLYEGMGGGVGADAPRVSFTPRLVDSLDSFLGSNSAAVRPHLLPGGARHSARLSAAASPPQGASPEANLNLAARSLLVLPPGH